jgi:hypothetical protein
VRADADPVRFRALHHAAQGGQQLGFTDHAMLSSGGHHHSVESRVPFLDGLPRDVYHGR